MTARGRSELARVERFRTVRSDVTQPAPADTLSVRRALSNLAPELRTLLERGTSRLVSVNLPSTSNWAIGPLSHVWHARCELREVFAIRDNRGACDPPR